MSQASNLGRSFYEKTSLELLGHINDVWRERKGTYDILKTKIVCELRLPL